MLQPGSGGSITGLPLFIPPYVMDPTVGYCVDLGTTKLLLDGDSAKKLRPGTRPLVSEIAIVERDCQGNPSFVSIEGCHRNEGCA